MPDCKHDCENRCGATYRFDDDPDNPYVGPQDGAPEPVTWRDFVPVVVGLALIVVLLVLIV